MHDTTLGAVDVLDAGAEVAGVATRCLERHLLIAQRSC